MPIKLSMPDSSPNGKRRLANAKGMNVEASVANSLTQRYSNSASAYFPITRTSQFSGSGANVAISQPMFFSPMFTPQNWQIASRRKEIYQWARFYYENEPKVAAGVDFYSQFPMNGFTLECKNKKVLAFFENVVKELKLNNWIKLISHEYFLLGDVFPFLSIECPHCGGKGVKPNGKPCNHPDGKFKSVTILNPDYVEVNDSPFPDQRQIFLVPDEQLKKTVLTREPKAAYDRIPEELKKLIASGVNILLSPRSVSHIKHSECPYGKYGTSMLRRLFHCLAYKTKLMTANWIVAERLVLPVRVIKLGDKERPAGPDDIADMQQQISAVANDPNLTIVTHHAFDYEWYGATGKIHNITAELEYIGKEILDGLMLNQALLNGEMQGYTSAQVGIETLIKRLDTWRATLAEWVEDHIFKPTAMMQGFIDDDKTKDTGKTQYLYPTIKFNDMQLRDKSNKLQMFMQLHDKGLISTEKLLEEFDIDYDQEMIRLRRQQVMSSPGGPAGGGGDVAGGAGGGMPAMGGGGGPMDMGGGAPPMGGDMGGGMGGAGGMPGAPGGGMGGGGAPPMGAAASGGKVYKKGKAPKNEEKEVQMVAPSFVKLTRLEQKVLGMIQDLQFPFKVFGQYQKKLPGENQPFLMDFALPEILVNIEADGAIWHEQEGAKERDAERDKKLASYGWRVLRFTENAITQKVEEVKRIISENIKEAAQERFSGRKKASSNGMIKYAGLEPVAFRYTTDTEIDVENIYIKLSDNAELSTKTGAIAQIISGVPNERTIQPDENSGSQEDQG